MTHHPAFVTYDGPDGLQLAAASYAGAQKASAALTGFRNAGGPGSHVRDGFDRRDYDFFRPGEQLPTRDKDVITACMQAYDRFPVVRNMVDLMADFACKGVDVVHPRARVEKFGKEWFHQRAGGRERSERVLNMLYRAGTAVVKRLTARLPDTTLDVLRASAAAADLPLREPDPLPADQIPVGYAVLDPRAVEVVGGEVAALVGPKAVRYAVRIPPELAYRLKNPKGVEAGLVGLLPQAVLAGAASEGRLVPLDPAKVVVLHYKKDDFQLWARPMLYPLLDHLQMLQKLMLSDRAALDGVINHVRLWRLGSLEHRIFPTEAAVGRLAEMLLNNAGGGSLDLIWGPELDLVETSTDISKALGQDKYVPTLQAIYQGLGVPPSLTGMAPEGGFTSTFMGLKVLVERLEYGRLLLTRFWEGELELLRARFGFREPFRVVFDSPTLSDEAALLKLLIDLADRNYVSVETLQERFGAIPEIEAVRLRREERDRAAGRAPAKAGPYHLDSQQQAFLQRAFVQQGAVAPSEVGVDLKPREGPHKTLLEHQAEQAEKLAKQKAKVADGSAPKAGGGGRPTGAVDTGPRKKKRVLPRTTAADAVGWAGDALAKLAGVVQKPFCAARGRATARELTAAEGAEFERFLFAVLCRFEPGAKLTRPAVKAALEAGPLAVPPAVDALYRAAVARHVAREGAEPPLEAARRLRAAVYALWKTEEAPDGQDCD